MNMLELIKKLKKHPVYLKYSIYPIPAFIFLLVLCLVIFLIYQSTLIINNAKLINEEKDKNTALVKKISELNNLDSSNYQNYYNLALIALPTESEVTTLIDLANYLVRLSNLTLVDISVGSGLNNQEEGGKVTFNLTVSGSKSSFNDFIEKVNNTSRVMKINHLQINYSGDNLQAQFFLDAFYSPLADITSSAEQQIVSITNDEQKILDKISINVKSSPAISTTTVTSEATGKTNPFE